MSVYYVATTGSDSNPGTVASPFLTIQKGVSVLSPGDTLFVRAGTYAETVDPTALTGGSAASPYTIQRYSNEVVTIAGNDNSSRAFVGAVDGLIIDGFVLDGTGHDNTVSMIGDLFDVSDVIIRNNEIKGWKYNGLLIGIVGHTAHNITIENNIIHDMVSVDANRWYGLYIDSVDGLLVKNNEIYNCPGGGWQVYPGPNSNVVLVGNRIHHCSSDPAGVGGMLLAGPATVYNNIIYNNGVNGIWLSAFGETGSDCLIFNNTVYNNAGWGVLIEVGSDNARVQNNILFSNASGDVSNGGSGNTVDHNFSTDPSFTDAGSADFSLQSTSPCIGAGADLSADGVTVDIINTPRPIDSTFDIGAYEYFSESVPGPAAGVGLADIAVGAEAFSPGPTAGVGSADIAVDAKAFSAVVVHRTAENPKTYLLHIVEKRDGANGISEIDFRREDLSIYPLIGANVTGGAPPPPVDPNSDHSDASIPGSTRLVLLDIPQLLADHTGPGFYAAASGLSDGWHGAVLYEKQGTDYVEIAQLGDRAKIGKCDTKLLSGDVTLFDATGRTYQFDDTNTLDVSLIESVSTLASVSDADIEAGNNIAVIGQPGRWEIVGFGTVTALAERKWRLSHLLRGLKGTEWAVGLHSAGDQFIVLDAALRRVKDEYSDLNVARKFRAVSIGNTFESANDVSFTDTGVSLTPLSPVFIRGEEDIDSNRVIRFWDRSRYDGLAGRDGTASPPADENPQTWEGDIIDGVTVVRTLTNTSEFFTYTGAQQAIDFGSAPSSLHIKIYKIGATIGRGYVGEATISSFDSVDPISASPFVTGPNSSTDNQIVLFDGVTGAAIKGATNTGILKASAGVIATAVAATDYVAPGAITTSGLTQATARLLGRTTASAGAVEEITVGSGLSLSGGSLSATGAAMAIGNSVGSGTSGSVLFVNSSGQLAQENASGNLFTWDTTKKALTIARQVGGVGGTIDTKAVLCATDSFLNLPQLQLSTGNSGAASSSVTIQHQTLGLLLTCSSGISLTPASTTAGWGLRLPSEGLYWFKNSFGTGITLSVGVASHRLDLRQSSQASVGDTNFATLKLLSLIVAGGSIDLSGIAATAANLLITATSDTPSTTWTSGTPSANPLGFLKISVGGNARYIPFWN